MKPIQILVILALMLSCTQPQETLKPVYLRTEYKENPVIDVQKPRFSWVLEANGFNRSQSAYHILVATTPEKLTENEVDVWNSDKVVGHETYQVVYQGPALFSRETYYWKVRSWDENDIPGEWSQPAKWEMGLLEWADWKGDWIAYNVNDQNENEKLFLPPAPYFRKEIAVKDNVKRARLYVTAFGVYEFFMNGKKVGNWQLSPGWTDYARRVHYQTFNVTDYITTGENALGAMVSKGWYAGYIGFGGDNQVYGNLEKLKAQLIIEYENGVTETIATDNSWKASTGALLESDLLHGETYDARLEPAGWKQAGYDDATWHKVSVYKGPEILLKAHPGNPVVILEDVTPKKIIPQPDGSYIFDMGQNFAGVVTLNTTGESGQHITLKYGEMLHPNGRLMTENLRSARATDTYIMAGRETGESWTPQFTFHGFQYVQVFGLSEKPSKNTITGKVVGSATPVAGSFECSNEMVNQLYSNIVWTQKSNFIDIPTDCPQRDERQGWTGDAQVYIQSAAFNTDIAAFYTKWLADVNDAQLPDGTFPNYTPFWEIIKNLDYSPGWGEAGIICPWQLYKSYGDTRLIKKYWDNMEIFMQYHIDMAGADNLHEEGTFAHLRPKGGFSDWLSVGKKTAPDLLSSMYFAYCSKLMAQMAEAIGKNERTAFYTNLNTKVRQAIESHYWDNITNQFTCDTVPYGDGTGYVDGDRGFTGHTQTAYANAIYMDILNDEKLAHAYHNLAELIEQNDNKLSTGFLGIKQLLPATSEAGRTDLAYTLLLNTEYPSWGFEIENGATTIWERWNSYTKEEGFVEGMNSFSHYAFGSVNEWMFGNMAGIKNPGKAYDSIVLQPEFDKRIDHVKAIHKTMNGDILSFWIKNAPGYEWRIKVPVNSIAVVKLPYTSDKITIEKGEEIKRNGNENNTELTIGSGNYILQIND